MEKEKLFFYIDSRNRLSGTTDDFTYKLNIPRAFNPKQCVLLSASIPKSYYAITDVNNKNQFILSENNNNVTITIEPGNYTRKSLQQKISSKLNSTGSYTYNVYYSNTSNNLSTQPDTGKFIFEVSGNSSIQPKFIFTNGMYEQMGFSQNTTYTFNTDLLEAPNVIKLVREDALYIHSDLVQSFDNNVLQNIYASNFFNLGVITWDNPTPEWNMKTIGIKDNNTYRFYLSDEEGSRINLNNINMVLTLCIIN